MKSSRRSAFSLVELSIVLVILGLLAGGILSGQSLIRAAELRSIAADFNRYNAAFYSFRDKYFALPGDMANATAFWGIAAGTSGNDATCQNTTGTGTTTCNGNGDGHIEGNSVSYGERFRAWQHLANAGMIEGSYTGHDGAATGGDNNDPNFNQPGKNIPKSRIPNASYIIAYFPGASGDINWFDMGGGWNHLAIQGNTSPPLKPEEAWNIDTKLDDGKPATGSVYTAKSSSAWSPGCATTDIVSTAAYNLTASTKVCILYYAIR